MKVSQRYAKCPTPTLTSNLGLASRGLASWIVTISFAYNGQWNSRRLENHFHAFWNLLFLDLVSDLTPETLVIPQFQLDIINDKPLAPDDSIITTSQPNAKVLTPDFAIAVFHLIRRHGPATLPALPVVFPTKFDSWRDVRVEKMKVPLIAELQAPTHTYCEIKACFPGGYIHRDDDSICRLA